MKTKESIYITPFGKFLTKMWNEIKCEWEYIGTFDDEKTAKKKIRITPNRALQRQKILVA